jgi:hypothetical protein
MKTGVLVVSESPPLIHHAFKVLTPLGVNVIGCLGPAHGPCKLESEPTCPLASHSAVAIIDSPASGSFACHEKRVSAATYAAELAHRHPDCLPILCGAPEGSGATGDSMQASSALSMIEILRQITCRDPIASPGKKESGHEG